MLDPDVYGVGMEGVGDDDDDTGGTPATGGRPNGTAGKSFGATGNAPSNGAAPSSGGKGGTTSTPMSEAVTACKAYCPGYGTQCAERLMGQDCFAACLNEVTGSGMRCQKLGIAALNCLQPFFTPGGFDCDSAVNRALSKCGKTVNNFEKCKGVPTPTPTMPVPPANVTDCPSMGTGSQNYCQMSYACNNGTYNVYCNTDLQTRVASCGCVRPDGAATGTSFMSTLDVCEIAAQALCN
jgi:hypothetical protein